MQVDLTGLAKDRTVISAILGEMQTIDGVLGFKTSVRSTVRWGWAGFLHQLQIFEFINYKIMW